MPLHAILRATLKVSSIAAVLVGLLAGAWLAQGAMRWGFGALLGLGIVAAWTYAYMLVPGLWLLRPLPWRGPRGHNRIAITFDDGPSEPHTAAILDVLRAHEAKATFFLLGTSVAAHPEISKKIGAEGHAIGSHTLNHTKLHNVSPARTVAEIEGGERALREAGVASSGLFRAPHGFKSPWLRWLLHRRGMRLIAWTDGVWDTDRPGVDAIVARAEPHLVDGEILLLHDGPAGADRAQTARALDRILARCRDKGLRAVTIPELLDP